MICVFTDREGKEERGGEGDSTSSLPGGTQWSALKQVAARSKKTYPHLPLGGRGPNTWTIFYHFSKAISRELDQNCSSQDINQYQYRMLALQTTASHTTPQWQKLVIFF